MKTPRAEDNTPQPCVWVSAGVLVTGLCDRDFDCDNCPLHQALSRTTERRLNAPAEWPSDRLYTDSHLWIQRLDDRARVRVGITPFAAELLHPVHAWRFSQESRYLPAWVPLVTVETSAGALPLRLPFSAFLEEVNPRIAVDTLWPLADPWQSGYLATMEPDESDALYDTCAPLTGMGRELVRHKQVLVQAATEAGHFDASRVRAADGGVPVSGWSRVLGREHYKEVLGEIFGVSPV